MSETALQPDIVGTSGAGECTRLLRASRLGDERAGRALLQLVYEDLRSLARKHLSGRAGAWTLGATGLVHECYLRMARGSLQAVADRRHFFNLASRIMRQVLCDLARRKLRECREACAAPDLMAGEVAPAGQLQAEAERLVSLDALLKLLERHNRLWARIVECRFFAGLTDADTALALGLSVRSTQRQWQAARQWLLVHWESARR